MIQHFPVLSRLLHWIMAVLILAMLFIGVAMVSSLSDYHRLVSIHKPIGILILVLVAIRLVNRLVNPPPPLPAGPYDTAARRTLAGISLIDSRLRQPDGKVAPYQPGGGATYEETEIGRSLQSVARVVRMDLGIRAFAIDMGGWDTHENQPPRLAALAGQLSRALAAFHTDLHDRLDRVVLVVMSEFGRRLRSNRSNGTDHGHAGITIVSAPHIAGGRIHGTWPGLSSDKLDNAVDLAVTTDIRSILAELMVGPLHTPQAVAAVFPDFAPKKVGLV